MSDGVVKKTKRKPTGAAAMGPGPGRPKGMPNKVTTAFRETVTALLEDNAENVARWLKIVAEGDGDQVKPDPGKALDLMGKLAEYSTPKLSRQEHVGDAANPLQHKVEISIVDAK